MEENKEETVKSVDEIKLPAGTGLLQKYMNDVQRFPVLDKTLEKKLTAEYAKTAGKPIAERDLETRTQLINHNLRLVVKIAFEYRAAYKDLMDLIQEGNIGLMKGIDKFDPEKEVPLANYVAMWIRAYMLRSIMNNARLVKVGTTEAQRKLFFNLSKEKAKLEAMGIEPSQAELAEKLEVQEKELVEMEQRMAAPEGAISVSDDEDKHDLPLVSETLQPDTAYEKEEQRVTLKEMLAAFRTGLEGKKLVVFDHRFMVEHPETLQVISEREDMKVSRARVQQIDAEIKADLRSYLEGIM
jgi:RNA polymerase sigma-32 factor